MIVVKWMPEDRRISLKIKQNIISKYYQKYHQSNWLISKRNFQKCLIWRTLSMYLEKETNCEKCVYGWKQL